MRQRFMPREAVPEDDLYPNPPHVITRGLEKVMNGAKFIRYDKHTRTYAIWRGGKSVWFYDLEGDKAEELVILPDAAPDNPELDLVIQMVNQRISEHKPS